MHKLAGKTKQLFSSNAPRPLASTNEPFHPPTPLDVLRYRHQHGANLGSIFVLEKWLFPSMFEPTAKGDSELDAVSTYVSLKPAPGPRVQGHD